MVAAAKRAGVANMVGFNYIRTPASQYARHLVASGAIGQVTWFRGEHTEDFDADATVILPTPTPTRFPPDGCLVSAQGRTKALTPTRFKREGC